MNKYEALYIIEASLDDDAIKAMVERINGIVTDNGGSVDSVNEWGKRRLAYPILDRNEGYYVLMTFTAAPEFPAELERNYHIIDSILRGLITRIE